MTNNVRLRRLINDQKILVNLSEKSQYIKIQPLGGDPPYKYLISYSIPGYLNQSGTTASTHLVEMILGDKYPIEDPPHFNFRDGLWHPNVYTGGAVCLGNDWNFGYDIDQLIIDVGNMIRFAPTSYNLDSPAQCSISKRQWQNWIKGHTIPLADIEFNVTDAPRVEITETKQVNIRLKEIKPKDIKIKIIEMKDTSVD